MKQIVLVLALMIALFAGAIRLPAQTCILSSSASEKACLPGCCANKTCCAVSTENARLPSLPLSKDGVSQNIIPNVALLATKLVAPQRLAVAPSAWFPATWVVPSPPRRALFCTFLI